MQRAVSAPSVDRVKYGPCVYQTGATPIDVVSVNTQSDKQMQTADMRIGLHITDTGKLALAMDKIRQLRNVQDVERVS